MERTGDAEGVENAENVEDSEIRLIQNDLRASSPQMPASEAALLARLFEALKRAEPTNLRQFHLASRKGALLVGHTRLLERLRTLLSKPKGEQNQAENDGRPRTALLFGPPGTGKGQLVKHLSAESGRPVLVVNASELSSPFVGEAEKNLARVFAATEETGALFLDELDALFGKDDESAHQRRLLATFQTLLDRTGAAVVGATNRPWALAEAVFRRFELRLYVGELGWREALEVVDAQVGRYFSEGGENQAGRAETRGESAKSGGLLALVSESSDSGGAMGSPFGLAARLQDAFSGRTGAEAQAVADALKREMVRAGRLRFGSEDLLRACRAVPRGPRGDFASFVAKWASE